MFPFGFHSLWFPAALTVGECWGRGRRSFDSSVTPQVTKPQDALSQPPSFLCSSRWGPGPAKRPSKDFCVLLLQNTKGHPGTGKMPRSNNTCWRQGLKLKPVILSSDHILSGPPLPLKSDPFVENSWKLAMFLQSCTTREPSPKQGTFPYWSKILPRSYFYSHSIQSMCSKHLQPTDVRELCSVSIWRILTIALVLKESTSDPRLLKTPSQNMTSPRPEEGSMKSTPHMVITEVGGHVQRRQCLPLV